MRELHIAAPNITIPDGVQVEDLGLGLDGIYGYVSEVVENEEEAMGLLIYVPSFSLADFREAEAEASK